MDKSSLLDRAEETSVSSLKTEHSTGHQSAEDGKGDSNGSILSRILPHAVRAGSEELPCPSAARTRPPQDPSRAYLTLVPSVSDQDPRAHYTVRNTIRKKNMRKTLLYMLLVAVVVASSVFVMVPRSLSIGQVVVVPDAMTWDTGTSSYNVRLNVTIPITNPNFVPYHVHGNLQVLFYDALAGKTVIQETVIPWRSFSGSIYVQMDASSVPKKYILSILSQCSTFPHVLTFFLQGNLYGSVLPMESSVSTSNRKRLLTERHHIAEIDTYFFIDYLFIRVCNYLMSTSIRTAAGQQQPQHTYGPVDTIDMFPLMNCGESADLGELLNGPSGMNGEKGLSQRYPASWADGSLISDVDIGQNPYSGNISGGGSMPLVPPPMMNFTNNGGYAPMQECRQFVPNGPMPFEMKQEEQQPPPVMWGFPPHQPGLMGGPPQGVAYPVLWQHVNGTLIPYFAPLPMYANAVPPSSDSDSGQMTTQCVASSEPTARRRACVERYRKKKARRSFKKHIRYQMRKDNADKRCRVKGRFVKSANEVV